MIVSCKLTDFNLHKISDVSAIDHYIHFILEEMETQRGNLSISGRYTITTQTV